MVAVMEQEQKPLSLPRISAKVLDVLAKLQQGLPLEPYENDLLLSFAEAALILTWKKRARVSEHYVRQMKYTGKLPAETEKPVRFRLGRVLQYEFDPPGPKPKDKSASRKGDGLSKGGPSS